MRKWSDIRIYLFKKKKKEKGEVGGHHLDSPQSMSKTAKKIEIKNKKMEIGRNSRKIEYLR